MLGWWVGRALIPRRTLCCAACTGCNGYTRYIRAIAGHPLWEYTTGDGESQAGRVPWGEAATPAT
jgi:hypothetical protein